MEALERHLLSYPHVRDPPSNSAFPGHIYSGFSPTQAVESWGHYTTTPTATNPIETVMRLASENAVVIFSISSCCMCHAVKRLFCGMGVNPTVYELDQDPRGGKEIERALIRLLGTSQVLPVVFIGGKLVGSMDRVMASHINGTLVPVLKDAGALWL